MILFISIFLLISHDYRKCLFELQNNIYMFSVIFLSNFKYFLIKLLNTIKYDHLHALNDDVKYLLNID